MVEVGVEVVVVASFSAFDAFFVTLGLTTLFLFSSAPTASDFAAAGGAAVVGDCFGSGVGVVALVRGF